MVNIIKILLIFCFAKKKYVDSNSSYIKNIKNLFYIFFYILFVCIQGFIPFVINKFILVYLLKQIMDIFSILTYPFIKFL